MAMPFLKPRLLSIGNLLAVLFALTLNSLANILPINGRNTGEISDSIPNLFVPAGLTFSIWGVIYLLMIVFMVYQLISAFSADEGKRNLVLKTGPWFILSSLANGFWIVAWHYGNVPMAMALMLILLGSLIMFYLRVNPAGAKSSGLGETVGFRVFAGVYLGWISVATIANATALLVTSGAANLWPGAAAWAVIVVLVAILLAVLMIFLRKDAAFPLVIAWALLGIVLKRIAVAPAEPAIVATAAAGAVALTVLALGSMAMRLLKQA